MKTEVNRSLYAAGSSVRRGSFGSTSRVSSSGVWPRYPMPNAARIRKGPSSTLKIRRGWRTADQISLKKNDDVRMMPFAKSTKNSPMALNAVLLSRLRVHQLDEDVVKAGVLLTDLGHLDVGGVERVEQIRHGLPRVLHDHAQTVAAGPGHLDDTVELAD